MLSDLQRRKLTAMFGFYDVDDDGYLEREDYEEVIRRFAEVRGWEPGSPGHEALTQGYMGVWAGLLREANRDGDQRVSLEEMLHYNERLIADEAEFDQGVIQLGVMLFDLVNVDGNDVVTRKELDLFYRGLGAHESLVEQVWQKLDVEGKGQMNRETVFERIREFYLSDDPDAPGNWLFGPF